MEKILVIDLGDSLENITKLKKLPEEGRR